MLHRYWHRHRVHRVADANFKSILNLIVFYRILTARIAHLPPLFRRAQIKLEIGKSKAD